jgi:hypothetical protein
MSSSEGAIRELAVQLCDIIAKARAISAGADTMTQAKQAGRIVVSGGHSIPYDSPMPFVDRIDKTRSRSQGNPPDSAIVRDGTVELR